MDALITFQPFGTVKRSPCFSHKSYACGSEKVASGPRTADESA
jgi:hypothetical protein